MPICANHYRWWGGVIQNPISYYTQLRCVCFKQFAMNVQHGLVVQRPSA